MAIVVYMEVKGVNENKIQQTFEQRKKRFWFNDVHN